MDKLQSILQDEPVYRLKQAKEAAYKQLIDNWEKAAYLPKALRDKLNQEFPLEITGEIFDSVTRTSSKAVIRLWDGNKIEAVLMRHKGRNTVCVSTQAGCSLGCKFCATGKNGFIRNLTGFEIVSQVLFFSRLLKKRVDNVVFMGMGEPFLNYDEVILALRILNDKDGLNIGSRHLSVSTSGITTGIKKFTQENFQVNLALSLHAADSDLRSKLMPINKKYPLPDVIKAVSDYLKVTNRKVMFEYIMINNVNDSQNQAEQLVSLLREFNKGLYFINLINYNPTGIFKPSSPKVINLFKNVLVQNKINVIERFRFGADIKAACGQLAGRKSWTKN